MKPIVVIITIVSLLVTFVGLVNAQAQDPQADSEAQKELANQPRPAPQLVIYWLAILIIAYAAEKLSALIVNQLSAQRGKPEFILRWLLPISRAVIYGLAFYIVFSGIIRRLEFGGYIIIGVFAIAFGFAGRDLLSSWLGGFVILFNRPFHLGDRIKIDVYEGEVIAMGLFSVKMMATDGQLVVVPNSRFLCRTVTRTTNVGMNSPVEVDLLLPSSVPLEQVEDIAREAALTSKYVYLPEPVLVTSADDFRGIFLTKLKVKASVFDFRYATQFAEDIRRRVKAELKRQRFSE
jgi:small-conductance mechanosensitive channel